LFDGWLLCPSQCDIGHLLSIFIDIDPYRKGSSTTAPTSEASPMAKRGYPDLHDHLDTLRARDLLWTIDEPVDKDCELHPLVRWQFRGGIPSDERRAFLFTNVRDAKGRRFEMPVVVGALAANPTIYAAGMGCPVEDIAARWSHAIAHPIAPVTVTDAPCHEVIHTGDALKGEGNGLDALPIPISTPGFDSAPTLTATNVITRDPDTGVQNQGTYRAGLKAPDRMVVRMATRAGGAGGYQHWKAYKARGEKMPCAVVLGCPPYVAFMGPQKLPLGMDEMEVAGGLAGEPIALVKAHSIDLMVPAEAEVVIEGLIDPSICEPEGPFGESHGHVALEEYNMPFEVTAITHRRDAVVPSYLSQVTPSESSVIKRVAYEPLFFNHLRHQLAIASVLKVSLHEPLTSLLRVTTITMAHDASRTEIWRALYGAASFKGDCGKITIAVNDDIDPDNADALLWALAYRHNPSTDLVVLPHRSQGHGPKREHEGEEDGTLLIDATMKSPMPPLALPTKPYMERAKVLWEKLDLPALTPESPWHGYSLGDWHERWEVAAERAAQGDYLVNGRETIARTKTDVVPETSVRQLEDDWD
jgi:UbiD family decarboxylase